MSAEILNIAARGACPCLCLVDLRGCELEAKGERRRGRPCPSSTAFTALKWKGCGKRECEATTKEHTRRDRWIDTILKCPCTPKCNADPFLDASEQAKDTLKVCM